MSHSADEGDAEIAAYTDQDFSSNENYTNQEFCILELILSFQSAFFSRVRKSSAKCEVLRMIVKMDTCLTGASRFLSSFCVVVSADQSQWRCKIGA